MRLFGTIQKVEQLDDGTIKVFGVASTESRDDQGEIVRASAMRAAIPQYMRYPALREMHQLSAAGCTLEASVDDAGATRVTAHVVDPVAVLKVKTGVYRAFSIGGRVTERDPTQPDIITGLQWNELSLVDRPANPEAVLSVWKASQTDLEGSNMQGLATIGDTAAGEKLAALAQPEQIWNCGNAEHRHLAKAEAVKCLEQKAADGAAAAQAEVDEALKAIIEGRPVPETPPSADGSADAAPGPAAVAEPVTEAAASELESGLLAAAQQTLDAAEAALAETEKADKPAGDYGSVTYADPGFQDDKKPRYPVDTAAHIRAAWSYIGMPKNQRQYSSAQVAHIKSKIVAAWKDKIDSAGPPSADDGKKAGQDTVDAAYFAGLIEGLGKAGEFGAGSLSPLLETLSKSDEFQKARHTMHNQTMLDLAAYASKCAMGKSDMPDGDRIHAGYFNKAVLDAGATDHGPPPEMLTDGNPEAGADEATQHSTVDTSRNAETPVPNPTGAVPARSLPPPATMKSGDADPVGALFEDLLKGAGIKGHQRLMQVAHDAIACACGGATCKAGAARPDSLSSGDMAHLDAAHYHYQKMTGWKCDAANPPPGGHVSPDAAGESTHQGTANTAKAATDLKGAAAVIAKVADAEPPATDHKADKKVKKLAKALEHERAEKAALAEVLGRMMPMMERLTKDVSDIRATPIPPSTIVRSVPAGGALTKAGDNGGGASLDDLSDSDLAAQIAKRDPQRQHLIAMKAAQQQPIRIARYSNSMTQREMAK